MSYDSEVAADSPAAYWKLSEANGSGTVADSAGSYTGTVQSGVTLGNSSIPAGMTGRTSALFNGSSGYITSTLSQAYTALSVEAWFNTNGSDFGSTVRKLVSNDHPWATLHGFDVCTGGGSRLIAGDLGIGSWVKLTGPAAYSDPGNNLWHHVVLTWDGTTAYVYVDGVQSPSNAASGTIAAGAHGVYIGYPDGDSYWNGLLSHVAVYTTALSSARVTAHYNAGTTAPSGTTVTPGSADGAGSVTAAAAVTGTPLLYAGSAVAVSGSWANTAGTVGSTQGDYATWTDAGAGSSAVLELAAFGAQDDVPAGSTVSDVRCTVRHGENPASAIASVTAQAYSGTAPVGSPQALTVDGAVHEDTVTFTGLAWADLADLRVRVTVTRN